MAVRRARRDGAGGENPGRVAENYRHYEATSPMRPEIGTQPQFRKKKPPATYRYDSSLAPALNWDGQNPAREVGEWLLRLIQEAAALPPPHAFDRPRELKAADGTVLLSVGSLHEAVEHLRRLGKPFLDWAGKAERLSFDVPTLPLFIHERLSTKAIVETLTSHRRDKQQTLFELFGDPQHPITDQTLRAYEYPDKWVNRLVLGDSLVVMNSLLHYEGLGGQVQMIYMDPPYGVKFGSNFQPFVRRRDVSHNDDADMTREPEMVKAYRDTWELGLHSYLTYMRDRLLLCRELLAPTGSIFVQISDENLHHVRELMDEVFGADNFLSTIFFRKKTMPLGSIFLESMGDFLLWYGRDVSRLPSRYRQLYKEQSVEGDFHWKWYELSDGSRHPMTKEQMNSHAFLPNGARIFRLVSMWPPTFSRSGVFPVLWRGKEWWPPPGQCYPSSPEAMRTLVDANRIEAEGNYLRYVLYLDDYRLRKLTSTWEDTAGARDQVYVVQTSEEVVRRCVLMATDPGDLVLDPTCGSGTTAYVAEQWGRRWITVDTSRVPLTLARQRLLTATFPYYQLKDHARGPVGGFVYARKQNRKGEEVGGVVPHVTLKSIANNEPPDEEVLVDRPEVDGGIVRVTGPFTVEATIPTPVDWEGDGVPDSGAADAEAHGSFVDRMLEVLRKSPVLHVGGGKTVTLRNVRPPAKTLSLSAEAVVANGDERPVALIFGPENGGLTQLAVHEALKEASFKGYMHLYAIGFAIQPDARLLIERSAEMGLPPASYVQATPDLVMGDLLKNMRSSQIFSVCGLPDVELRRLRDKRYEVKLTKLNLFDPATMSAKHMDAADVPAWFLDTDYNGLCFHVCQAFFPRTGAWDDLRRALRGEYDDAVWEHLAGTVSAPFEAGEHGQVAVKVIDDRGNELLVVKRLTDAGA
ncbi:MAG: site-specific DNA-methyltransferase [Candidatus Rokubacteria bacterium]|nr:site-specific DNA-methyltransferase [Candidatus Rokubacteria bacterium]MBI3107531.1 site-specific DNA-methyltransferase [Candidatus Rokubacteria bacterium]